jgi:MFS family permease
MNIPDGGNGLRHGRVNGDATTEVTMSSTATDLRHDEGSVRSLIPARLDRLPWSSFHTRLVVALGVAWILDGLEITIASNIGPTMQKASALHMSAGAVGLATGTVYLVGEICGAILFGRLSDAWGRRKLFMITLGVYLVGSGLTAATWDRSRAAVLFLYACRFIAGSGIGGEYAAINSAIDELIPANFRGRVDIAVNGTYWGGAMLGTLGTLLVLNNLSPGVSWRVAFLLGPVLAFVILFVRRNLPESPRWQLMHGHAEEAERSIRSIEEEVRKRGHELEDVPEDRAIEIRPTERRGFLALAWVLFRNMPRRSVLGASLMVTQAFLYNAIFFSYALVLSTFYGIPASSVPWYFLAFAAGNLLGPLTIGRLFDTIGRRPMIAGTYILSGVLLALTAVLFNAQVLTVTTQMIAFSVIFFFASAGASAAYLTVSEIFPVEIRAQAIAVFFAIAQAFGAFGAWFYPHLVGQDRGALFVGYLIGAGVRAFGGTIAAFLGVAAERKSLEDVASPLSLVRKAAAGVYPGDGSTAGPRISPATP